MCSFLRPNIQTQEVQPQPTANQEDVNVRNAADEERRRARLRAGLSSTLLTGGSGLAAPNTTSKTLLGQ